MSAGSATSVEGFKAQLRVRFPRLAAAGMPLVRRVRKLAYRGTRVECPCCGDSFRRFVAHRGRPDAVCPGCRSLERHRLLWLFIEREFGLAERGATSVLHFAPESAIAGRLSAFEAVDYLSVDLDPDAAMISADITDLPFDDARFDLILCNHVLEHVPRDRVAMRELVRVLRPGGTALLMHPVDYSRSETYEDWSLTSPDERLRAFLQEDHVRLYGRDLPERLAAAGFDVEVDRYVDRVGEDAAHRYGLGSHTSSSSLRGDDIYVCRRPAAAGEAGATG